MTKRIKKEEIGSALSAILGQWKSQYVDDRDDQMTDGEALISMEAFVLEHAEGQNALDNTVRQLLQAKWNGIKKEASKDVDVGEQGELFPETWFEHGMQTPEGYIPHGATTPEHREIKIDQIERKIEKVTRQLDIENQRNQVLNIGFEQGAKTSKEALSYLDEEPKCDPPTNHPKNTIN